MRSTQNARDEEARGASVPMPHARPNGSPTNAPTARARARAPTKSPTVLSCPGISDVGQKRKTASDTPLSPSGRGADGGRLYVQGNALLWDVGAPGHDRSTPPEVPRRCRHRSAVDWRSRFAGSRARWRYQPARRRRRTLVLSRRQRHTFRASSTFPAPLQY
jgi:hypothetical protein